ncbi:MAG: twin-arginine translocation signal domain-containing protein [Nanoarchaeota archaeon]|nr:twin-arginine translocation signal domain-containing protein [Nanoarchaeota archaeon]
MAKSQLSRRKFLGLAGIVAGALALPRVLGGCTKDSISQNASQTRTKISEYKREDYVFSLEEWKEAEKTSDYSRIKRKIDLIYENPDIAYGLLDNTEKEYVDDSDNQIPGSGLAYVLSNQVKDALNKRFKINIDLDNPSLADKIVFYLCFDRDMKLAEEKNRNEKPKMDLKKLIHLFQ